MEGNRETYTLAIDISTSGSGPTWNQEYRNADGTKSHSWYATIPKNTLMPKIVLHDMTTTYYSGIKKSLSFLDFDLYDIAGYYATASIPTLHAPL